MRRRSTRNAQVPQSAQKEGNVLKNFQAISFSLSGNLFKHSSLYCYQSSIGGKMCIQQKKLFLHHSVETVMDPVSLERKSKQ